MKRSTSILLYVLLPIFWALVLVLGFFIYTFNQDPAGFARSLSARFSAPEAGFVLSVDQASLSLFPRPAASVSGLTIRTPAMTLFVDEGAVYPDLWALLHGETRIAGVRLLKPALLLEPPTGTTPETLQQPQFSIPPQLAEMEIDVEDGTVAYLLPDTNKSGLHPQWRISGISGSAAIPGKGEPGELSLSVGKMEWYGNTPPEKDGQATPLQTLSAINLEISDLEYAFPADAPATLRFKATYAMPLSRDEGSPRFVLGMTARTTEGTLAIDGAASLDGTFSLKSQSVPVHALLPFTTEAPLSSLFQGPPLPQVAVKGATLNVDGDQATLDGRLNFGADFMPTLRGTLAIKRFCLPRWFGFARDLPPGVQAALDNLSGTLPFELTPQKFVVSSATATALNTVFTGGGGVTDFSNPVIALHLATKDIPLNRVFPEVENKTVSAPSYKAPPLLGEDDSNTTVGYDIHLEAARSTFWKWAGNGVSVRITPDPTNKAEQTKIAIRCASLYGGSVQGDLIPGDVMALNLTASGVNIGSLLSPLAGYPVLKGTLTGSANFTARPTSPAAFLSSLKGKGEALIEKGNLSLSRTKKDKPLAFSQLRIAFQGAGSRTQGAQPHYAYTGKWQGNLATEAGQGALDLTGTLQFPASGPFNLFADAVSASGKLSANGISGQASGKLSLNTQANTLEAKGLSGQLLTKGASASFIGSVSGNGLNTNPAWDASLSVSTGNLRAFLAQWDMLPSSLPQQALRQAQAKAKIRMDESVLRFSGLEGRIDETRLTGQIECMKGTPPHWIAKLRLGTLRLGDYLPTSSKYAQPSTPWQTEWLRQIQLDGELSVDRLIIARIPHENLTVPVTIKNGVLTADPIKARVAGGAVGAGLRAEATAGGLLSRLRYTLNAVNILTLCKERGQAQLLSGTGSLDADVSGLLRSGADIPAALNGNLNFVIRNGELDAKKPGPMSRFSSLSASGTLSKGILTTRDLNLSGGLSVRGQGNINLINNTLNYALNVTGPGIPDIPVRYYGSLDAPQRSFNATGILANVFNSIGNGVLNILDIVVSAPLRLLAP